MVIKGRSRSNGIQLAEYLLASKENDRAHVLDIRRTAQPHSLRRSLLEMSMSSDLTKRGTKGLYHAQINPAIGEDGPMTLDDWLRAAEVLEQSLGLEGQKRAIVLHEKHGRLHGHVVWERYDHDTGKLRTDSQNFKKHDQARAQIEQELGHDRTPQKADREPTDKERLSDLWRQHPEGASFVQAAAEAGYQVAQGNARRPFRVVTPDGQSLDLTRQLDDAKAKDVRDRLQPIRDELPTEADALQRAKVDRQRAAEPSQLQSERPDNLRELSDSQDLAMAMLDRNKPPQPEQVMSYTFSFKQTLKDQPAMLYSDLLAQQEEELRKANHDYYVSRETIKKMQEGHFDKNAYAGEVERLDAAHAKNLEDTKARFEQERKEYLNEAPSLPHQSTTERKQSDKGEELYDHTDNADTILKAYKQQQIDRKERQRAAKAEQTEKQQEQSLDDENAEMLRQYRQQQRGRGRGLDALEI